MQKEESTNRPIHVVDMDNIRAAVFKGRDSDSESESELRVAFGRRYRDKDGRWKTSCMLELSQVEKGIKVLEQILEHLPEPKEIVL